MISRITRGRKFGTILVDLELHQVIDVLAKRSRETSADWMRDHPEISYVSRDRGKDDAQGASEGAPQATQISDRFHLMKNFVEAIESEVSRCYRHLRQMQLPLPTSDLPAPDEWRQAPEADAQRKRLARLANKQERFEEVKELLSRGLSAKEIAQQLALPVRTVSRWQEREGCPAHQSPRIKRPDKQERYEQAKELRRLGLSHKEIAQRLAVGVRTGQRWQGLEISEANPPRRKRRSIFDPYPASVLSRGPQGERSVSLLWQAIRSQGFAGSLQTMYRRCREHCVKRLCRFLHPESLIVVQPKKRSGFSLAPMRISRMMSSTISKNYVRCALSYQLCIPLPNHLGRSSASVKGIDSRTG